MLSKPPGTELSSAKFLNITYGGFSSVSAYFFCTRGEISSGPCALHGTRSFITQVSLKLSHNATNFLGAETTSCHIFEPLKI